MNLVITILIILTVSYAATLAGKKIRISSVIVLIFMGLFMGISVVREVIIEPNSDFVYIMGDVGLFALMFLAGLESSWQSLYKEKRGAIFIASFTALIPFLLGLAVFLMMGFSLLVSSIVGICMSVTAEATRARVLLELNKLKTSIGAAMMGAGIIDDVFGLSLFILITYLLNESYIKEDLLIAGAIMMFFVGVLVQKNMGREHKTIKYSEKILFAIIVPFFFISIGLHFDFGSILINSVLLLVILIIAVSSKLIGSFLTKPFTNFSWKQLHLIGWAMNSRGAVELALALIAFRSGLITNGIYSSLIIMAVTTTLIFPFIIMWMVKREPGIMD